FLLLHNYTDFIFILKNTIYLILVLLIFLSKNSPVVFSVDDNFKMYSET
ncbi:hypothetical protein HMPREF1343_02702, partial [Enterococcus faecalis ERV93]